MTKGRITNRLPLAAIALALALCLPSPAQSDDSGAPMSGSVAVGLGQVDGATNLNIEFDFSFTRSFYGLGFFLIDNGNLPAGLRDYPPPGGDTTVDEGWYRDSETGGYIRIGRILSGVRLFGTIGASDVNKKHVVRSTVSGNYYVTEEKTEDFQMLYGGGIGYLIADRVMLEYQYDNRRKGLLMVGYSF